MLLNTVDMKSGLLSVAAALAFASGGLLMKPAQGLHRALPTVALVVLFGIGAALNALVVHRGGGEVGAAYVFVIGCETLLAFSLAVIAYNERVSWGKVGAVLLIAAGSIALAVQEHDSGSQPSADTPSADAVAAPQ